MPSAALAPSAQGLYERLASLDPALGGLEERSSALDRFFALSSGRERPGRYWRVDFESILPEAAALTTAGALAVTGGGDGRAIVCDLATAAREHPDLLARALGKTNVPSTKFGALARAFLQLGTFVYVPADRALDEPIVIAYAAPANAAVCPYTIVLAERGSRATIVERLTAQAGSLLVAAAEIVLGESATIEYAAIQTAGEGARVLSSRSALPGRDAAISLCSAELGGAVAAGDLYVRFEYPGARARIGSVFFPTGTEHVDVVSTVDHQAADASSETLVKSAAREHGQARFLGNIRIAPHAQGSDARLRDDALLLSPDAHVDSVPALEIGANDVKAYHGATVGALDEEQIFYMQSRGIERDAAERTIALGFFEPAVEYFPTKTLRDEIRAAIAAKLQ